MRKTSLRNPAGNEFVPGKKKNQLPFLHGYKHASESQLPSPNLKFGQSTVDDSHLILVVFFFFPPPPPSITKALFKK